MVKQYIFYALINLKYSFLKKNSYKIHQMKSCVHVGQIKCFQLENVRPLSSIHLFLTLYILLIIPFNLI